MNKELVDIIYGERVWDLRKAPSEVVHELLADIYRAGYIIIKKDVADKFMPKEELI